MVWNNTHLCIFAFLSLSSTFTSTRSALRHQPNGKTTGEWNDANLSVPKELWNHFFEGPQKVGVKHLLRRIWGSIETSTKSNTVHVYITCHLSWRLVTLLSQLCNFPQVLLAVPRSTQLLQAVKMCQNDSKTWVLDRFLMTILPSITIFTKRALALSTSELKKIFPSNWRTSNTTTLLHCLDCNCHIAVCPGHFWLFFAFTFQILASHLMFFRNLYSA